jgi:hypothetical protein
MKTVVSQTLNIHILISVLLCGCCVGWSTRACAQTNVAGNLEIDGPETYTQSDGTLVAGSVTIRSVPEYLKGGGGILLEATFTLAGGILECSNMDIAGEYFQTGGTNFVAGDLVLAGYYADFKSSAVLCVSNFDSSATFAIDVGGTVVITNELRLQEYDGLAGPYLGSGDLTVSNITLTSGSTFSFGGRSLNQSGVLSIENAHLFFSGPGTFNLGRLQLNPGPSSTISVLSNQCILRLADSRAMTWSNAAVLNIQNWSGSLYGGGQQQIIFGSDNLALTPQQLSQIQFQNPGGLAPGNYPARILGTGEIVPDSGAPLPLLLNLLNGSSNGMQLHVQGKIGQTYGIDVSTDLVHWLTWTSQMNTNGTILIDDASTTDCPQRFYRAYAVP